MKFFTKSSILQKIIIVIVIVISFNFIMAPKVHAANDWGIAGTLAKEIIQFVVFIADSMNGIISKMMLDVDISDIMLDKYDSNIKIRIHGYVSVWMRKK